MNRLFLINSESEIELIDEYIKSRNLTDIEVIRLNNEQFSFEFLENNLVIFDADECNRQRKKSILSKCKVCNLKSIKDSKKCNANTCILASSKNSIFRIRDITKVSKPIPDNTFFTCLVSPHCTYCKYQLENYERPESIGLTKGTKEYDKIKVTETSKALTEQEITDKIQQTCSLNRNKRNFKPTTNTDRIKCTAVMYLHIFWTLLNEANGQQLCFTKERLNQEVEIIFMRSMKAGAIDEFVSQTLWSDIAGSDIVRRGF